MTIVDARPRAAILLALVALLILLLPWMLRSQVEFTRAMIERQVRAVVTAWNTGSLSSCRSLL